MDKKQTSQAELPPAQEEQVPANPPSRKRQLHSDDDADPQTKRAGTTRPTEPARLTCKNLALFDKVVKNKTLDPTDDSSTTTTGSSFAIQARKNGILDPKDSKPPLNLEDIRKRLAKSRATASPPESQYGDYVHAVGEADNEATMVGDTLPLLKTYLREPYKRTLNQAFTAFPKDVGFNNGLSAPQPDFVEGPGMQDFHPFPVDEYVNGAVLHKNNPRSITLPHLAGEWKGPGGDMREATLQSGYDGAALVYARNQALTYQGKSDPPGHASITTFTTNGTQLNFYAHYATPAGEGTLEYHQFPIKSMSLVNSYGEHKDGRRGLRNEQDHAKRQSQALKDQLKEYYKKQRSGGLHPVAEGVPSLPVPGVEPDAYEDEGDYEVVEPQPIYQPTPPTLSKPKHSKSHHSQHSHYSQHSHHSHSTPHSSKAPTSTHSSTHGSVQKRKVPSSQGSSSHHSKYKNYWKKDAKSGLYYHRNSNGTTSWFKDEEDEHD